MSDLNLTLGDFTFENFEIPEKITFGGSQKLVTHELVGGGRVIDAMGRSDAPLSWTGLFMGEQANNRARYLNNLRIKGAALDLTFHEMKYKVVIENFTADFQRYYQVPYSISCVVVEDSTTPLVGVVIQQIDTLLDEDMTTANTLGDEIADPTLTTKLNALQTAIKNVSDFAKATQATINSVLQPLADAQAQVRVLIGSVGATIENVTTLGGILPNNPIAQNARKITNQVVSMTNLPKLYDLQSVLGRMGGNIGTIGNTGQSVDVSGGSLYGVASKYYGDATKWTDIT
jgi:hypothetical protein